MWGECKLEEGSIKQSLLINQLPALELSGGDWRGTGGASKAGITMGTLQYDVSPQAYGLEMSQGQQSSSTGLQLSGRSLGGLGLVRHLSDQAMHTHTHKPRRVYAYHVLPAAGQARCQEGLTTHG